MKLIKKDRDWTPVRSGTRYCSPACGCRCSYAAYQLAKIEGDAMKRQMKSWRWRVRIWENVGWHHSIVLSLPDADVEVFQHSKNSFWCSMVLNGKQFVGRGRTPNTAFRKAFKNASSVPEALERVAPHV